jgi:hypothetical protein
MADLQDDELSRGPYRDVPANGTRAIETRQFPERGSNGYDNFSCTKCLGRRFLTLCTGELLERWAPAKEQCPEVRGGIWAAGLDRRGRRDTPNFPLRTGRPLSDTVSGTRPK